MQYTFTHRITQMRHIRRAQGQPDDPSSVKQAAKAVFTVSGLDVETGAISEEMFIAACLREASPVGFGIDFFILISENSFAPLLKFSLTPA
jgi:hypothetical protein